MTIHLGRHASREGWVSFETHPRLLRTKERLHARCLPCLTGLLEQLRAGLAAVELREAWDCWKVTAVTRSREECLELLRDFSETHPGEYVYGKFGKGRADRDTFALIFHTEDAQRRDELLALLGAVAARRAPPCRVFASRACGNPYEDLLGPWERWRPVSPILHPDRVAPVVASLRESLHGSPR